MDSGKKIASENDDDTLKGWTREDKFVLFEALKAYGTRDIAKISECTGRTEEDIVNALKFYKKKAFKFMPQGSSSGASSSGTTSKKTKTVNLPNEHIPLVGWAKKMMESQNIANLSTETSTALRLIAEFENFPDPKDTYDIDFKEVYHTLADAIDGKPLRDNKGVKLVLEKCVIDTALSCKSLMDPSLVPQALDNDSVHVQKSSSNIELSVLRQLISQEAYNPLKISEEHLKANDAI